MNKRCPKCGQTFADQNLNFCLNDGELLMYQQEASRPFDDEPPPTKFTDDDSPPTLMMNRPRDTNSVGWADPSPPAVWHGQQVVTPAGHFPVQYASAYAAPNQVLGILSIVLGGCSVTIGWCCSSGLLLSPAAIILGIIAMVQNRNNPEAYGGRGLAIGGIVLGSLFLLGYILLIIIYGIALIGGGIR